LISDSLQLSSTYFTILPAAIFSVRVSTCCGRLVRSLTHGFLVSDSDHANSSVTPVLPPPGQNCGTDCLNSFSNRTSPSDNTNDR